MSPEPDEAIEQTALVMPMEPDELIEPPPRVIPLEPNSLFTPLKSNGPRISLPPFMPPALGERENPSTHPSYLNDEVNLGRKIYSECVQAQEEAAFPHRYIYSIDYEHLGEPSLSKTRKLMLSVINDRIEEFKDVDVFEVKIDPVTGGSKADNGPNKRPNGRPIKRATKDKGRSHFQFALTKSSYELAEYRRISASSTTPSTI
ncbi:hypothetical protein DL96DRAFT_1734810 [Flagelloscypha sp. PMI_526]|nr:hypothetical protein DL96DRAFT_1734810 [Flagelloscypha sp. PMI_526]